MVALVVDPPVLARERRVQIVERLQHHDRRVTVAGADLEEAPGLLLAHDAAVVREVVGEDPVQVRRVPAPLAERVNRCP